MVENEELKKFTDEAEIVLDNLHDLLKELNDLKKDLRNSVNTTDYRKTHMSIELRKSLTDCFRLLLDYNLECTKLRERLFNATLKLGNPEEDNKTFSREVLDNIVRRIENTQKMVSEAGRDVKELVIPEVKNNGSDSI